MNFVFSFAFLFRVIVNQWPCVREPRSTGPLSAEVRYIIAYSKPYTGTNSHYFTAIVLQCAMFSFSVCSFALYPI